MMQTEVSMDLTAVLLIQISEGINILVGENWNTGLARQGSGGRRAKEVDSLRSC